jgi:citrate lyase subunit beta / citryl-CoA lyase
MTDPLTTAVAPLFVPGDRPERFARAVASADLAILDLEDAVAAGAKDAAERAVLDALRTGTRAVVRICAVTDERAAGQIESLCGSGVLAVMVPKAEEPAQLRAVADRTGVPVIALVESARGVQAAAELAVTPGVARLALGLLDLAADLFVANDSPMLDAARAAVVLAGRAAGLPAPWDSPAPQITDLEAVRAAASRSRAWGFGGRLCIHPAQVPLVRAAFRPSDVEVDWAHRVLAAGESAAQVDGVMVDRPVLLRARQILAALDAS